MSRPPLERPQCLFIHLHIPHGSHPLLPPPRFHVSPATPWSGEGSSCPRPGHHHNHNYRSIIITSIRPQMMTTTTMMMMNPRQPPQDPIDLISSQPPRPNPCTYWVTPYLLAGEYPGSRRHSRRDHGSQDGSTSPPGDALQDTRSRIRAYLDCGITAFVDLTHPGEKLPYEDILRDEVMKRQPNEEVSYVRMPIQDFGIPSQDHMRQILDLIDQATLVTQNTNNNHKRHKVYVHCRGGIGRTGTVVGCYLIRRHGLSGPQALDHLAGLFRHSQRSNQAWRSPETTEQIAFVENWAE